MPELVPVLPKNKIHDIVAALAEQISRDYSAQDLVLVCVLKGAFIFLADLIRQLSIPVQIDFLRVGSYASGTTSSGTITLSKTLEVPIGDRSVVLVEDIVDTGLTLEFLINYLNDFKPASLKICALIDKGERRKKNVHIDYIGCTIDHGFLVGYGLDYAEKYRHLPEIYDLKF